MATDTKLGVRAKSSEVVIRPNKTRFEAVRDNGQVVYRHNDRASVERYLERTKSDGKPVYKIVKDFSKKK